MLCSGNSFVFLALGGKKRGKGGGGGGGRGSPIEKNPDEQSLAGGEAAKKKLMFQKKSMYVKYDLCIFYLQVLYLPKMGLKKKIADDGTK